MSVVRDARSGDTLGDIETVADALGVRLAEALAVALSEAEADALAEVLLEGVVDRDAVAEGVGDLEGATGKDWNVKPPSIEYCALPTLPSLETESWAAHVSEAVGNETEENKQGGARGGAPTADWT